MDVKEILQRVEYDIEKKSALLKKDLLGKRIYTFGDNIIRPEK